MVELQDRKHTVFSILSSATEAGLEVVLLRNYGEIVDGSFRDVDLLCENFSEEIFEAVVGGQGVIVKKIKRLFFFQYSIFDPHANCFILFDIWTNLHYKGVLYFPSDKQFRILSADGFSRLDEPDACAVAIIKCLTQSGTVKEKYSDYYKDNKKAVDEVLAQSKFAHGKVGLWWLSFGFFLWALSFVSVLLSKKQLILYLLGPDGAGKTSIANLLIESELRAQHQYHHGRIPFLPRLTAIAGKKPKKVSFGDKKKKFTALHAIYYSIDGLLSGLRLKLSRGFDVVVISDRSMYDIVAREEYRSVPMFLRRLLVATTPKPDFVFLLKASATEINARKPELPVEEIDAQYQSYDRYASKLSMLEVPTGANDKSLHIIAQYLRL